jgi:hypothetical protein
VYASRQGLAGHGAGATRCAIKDEYGFASTTGSAGATSALAPLVGKTALKRWEVLAAKRDWDALIGELLVNIGSALPARWSGIFRRQRLPRRGPSSGRHLRRGDCSVGGQRIGHGRIPAPSMG